MEKKIVLLMLLTSISLVFANPISFGISISGGLQETLTDNGMFTGTTLTTDDSFVNATIKSGLRCLYKNTGLYVSGEKLIGDYRLKRYFIFSGGLIQRIPLSEKTVLDLHLGTTWHSVDAAIHSFVSFFVYTHYRSLPGLDAGIRYDHAISENVSLFTEVNYNYDKHYDDCLHAGLNITYRYKFQTISLNVGVLFSLL
ncbi:MAG: hypothetical protein K9N05_00175 [Candidatus Marinimicrobia bacterium]|nr:hypothetical protein [Candidatus Neomarinimicrobiota bacterium]